MKKLLFVVGLMLAFTFSASAGNNVHSHAVKSKLTHNKTPNKKIVWCTVCMFWNGGGMCATAETCAEAEFMLFL